MAPLRLALGLGLLGMGLAQTPPPPTPPTTLDFSVYPESLFFCDANLQLTLNGTTVTCGTEVLQPAAQASPVFAWPAADPTQMYTIILVDRDAPSAESPTRSPIRHGAGVNISGAALAAGITSNATTFVAQYSGPQPPPGSGCHRYYAMLYAQSASAPPMIPVPSVRFNWDFVSWAASNSLTKLSVNYWRTQNFTTTNFTMCPNTPPPMPPPSPMPPMPPPPTPPTTLDFSVYPESLFNCDANLQLTLNGTNVTCGTEVLQPAAQASPVFAWPAANPALFYTIVLVDRDAPSAEAPIRSPIRHGVGMNISGAALAAGITSNATTFAAQYSGPRPPPGTGCHRYYAILYSQSATAPPMIPPPASNLNFNFVAWAASNGLTKLSVNYWRTQNFTTTNFTMCPNTPPPMPPPPAPPPPSTLDFSVYPESLFYCDANLRLTLNGTAVNCGTEVLQPAAQASPVFAWPAANPAQLYTIVVVDRDARSAADPSLSPIRHGAGWNIPGSALAAGVTSNATTFVAPYSGPQPPPGSGCHRYYAILYSQNPSAPPTIAPPTARTNWNFAAWAASNGLTKVSVNYWRTQNYTTTNFTMCPNTPPPMPPSMMLSPSPPRPPMPPSTASGALSLTAGVAHIAIALLAAVAVAVAV